MTKIADIWNEELWKFISPNSSRVKKKVLEWKHKFPCVFLKILLITPYKKYGTARGQSNRWQSVRIVPHNVTFMPPNEDKNAIIQYDMQNQEIMQWMNCDTICLAAL